MIHENGMQENVINVYYVSIVDMDLKRHSYNFQSIEVLFNPLSEVYQLTQ